MIRSLIALLLATLACVASAQSFPPYTFTVEPASPIAGQPIQVRVQVSDCILIPPVADVVQVGSSIELRMEIPDFCNPILLVPERVYSLGTLPVGVYNLTYLQCSLFPPPAPRCQPLTSRSLVVGGLTTGPRVVPALSWLGLSAMLTSVLFVGLMVGRHRFD